MRSSKGRIPICLNNGLVWSRYPALQTIRMASFCFNFSLLREVALAQTRTQDFVNPNVLFSDNFRSGFYKPVPVAKTQSLFFSVTYLGFFANLFMRTRVMGVDRVKGAASWAENALTIERKRVSGDLQSLYSLVCGWHCNSVNTHPLT